MVRMTGDLLTTELMIAKKPSLGERGRGGVQLLSVVSEIQKLGYLEHAGLA